MSKFDLAIQQTFGQWAYELWLKYYFKFVLPKIESTTVDGIHLDLTSFSPKIRNRILMGYEEAEKRMCRDLLSADDCVVEIGSAIGFLALFCQKRIGIQNYIAIEANPMTIDVLKRNFRLNNVTPNVWNLALGKENGVAELHVGGDFYEHFVSYAERASRVNTIRVATATLETILKSAGEKFNALIIDVEGAERYIRFEDLPEQINKIIIEVHPRIIGKSEVAKILRTLQQKGFRTMHEQDDSYALFRDGAETNP